jgi:hypothetical protein
VSPPLIPTSAVLKLGGSIPINRLMPLVRLRFCQWSSIPMFLLVSILTETYPLVTPPFSTRWSPPAVLSGVVLKLSGMVSTGGLQWRGTHDQWLVKRLNPVPVAIGDFDGLFYGSALLGLKSLPQHPLSWVWDRSVFGFLWPFSRSLRFSSLACVLACPWCFPLSLDSSPVLNSIICIYKYVLRIDT